MRFKISKASSAAHPAPLSTSVNKLKTIPHSIYEDPAFSADPSSNPLSTSSLDISSWVTDPPKGHPILKSSPVQKNPINDSSGEVTLIQPPNSPAPPDAQHQAPTCMKVSLTPSPVSPSARSTSGSAPSLSSLSSSVSTTHTSLESSPHLVILNQRKTMPSATPLENSKKRIGFSFFKRKSMPEPAPSHGIPRSATSPTAATTSFRDVDKEAVAPQNSINESNLKHPGKEMRRVKPQELDMIDELDESNPLGVALHHGGPYEAIQKVVGSNPYTQTKAHKPPNVGQTSATSQFRLDVSLNLSPGQVLPHSFTPYYRPRVPLHPVNHAQERTNLDGDTGFTQPTSHGRTSRSMNGVIGTQPSMTPGSESDRRPPRDPSQGTALRLQQSSSFEQMNTSKANKHSGIAAETNDLHRSRLAVTRRQNFTGMSSTSKEAALEKEPFLYDPYDPANVHNVSDSGHAMPDTGNQVPRTQNSHPDLGSRSDRWWGHSVSDSGHAHMAQELHRPDLVKSSRTPLLDRQHVVPNLEHDPRAAVAQLRQERPPSSPSSPDSMQAERDRERHTSDSTSNIGSSVNLQSGTASIMTGNTTGTSATSRPFHNRFLPKKLVMPAPLATAAAGSIRPQPSVLQPMAPEWQNPLRQHHVRFHDGSEYDLLVTNPASTIRVEPPSVGRAQDVPMSRSRKLKKRSSLTSPEPPEIIARLAATPVVSARSRYMEPPPTIPETSGNIGIMKMKGKPPIQKEPMRLLSKRRSGL
ncbi:hypothetical protein AMATHDRAFT_83225 [Amanita thiersii Skay4041]|uniref:Uncharacterized protein n=1 Tax=Amanita thiersii Skay4041 TaxID=703135 RepID=A0A2A9P146_9AGAR|nr:hypothetical protein AMATHDRAFT_83225 [Amanita thiersii Skay4041]